MIQLLVSMKISINLLVTAKCGCYFMGGNVIAMSHIKHVDIKYKYVNEYVKDDIAKIVFIKCGENGSNILMKNPGRELHQKHSKKFIGENSKWFF